MTLKEMEAELTRLKAELTRLKAEAATNAETLTAKDSEISNLKAKDEASQKSIADLTASTEKLQAENSTLAEASEKLKTELKAAQMTGSRQALNVIAESGHPAPTEGSSQAEASGTAFQQYQAILAKDPVKAAKFFAENKSKILAK